MPTDPASPASPTPVAVITGAGSGIGRATALALGARGWRVVLAARTEGALRETADLVRKGAPGAPDPIVIPTDVAEPDQVRALIDRAHAGAGRLDALVNNAGLATLLPIAKTDERAFLESLQVNSVAPALAILRAWPHFAAQRSGCVVNVSTMGTSDPFPGFFAYAAAKASVNLMARSCALEGKSIGVRAFAVAPAAVETPMLRSLFDLRTVPSKACLTPEDVARVIVDCVLGQRDADNGKTIFLAREPAGGIRERVA